VWHGVRYWDVFAGMFGLAIAMAVAAWRVARKPARSSAAMILYASGNAALIMMTSRLAGPFTFVPALTCVIAMSAMAYPVFTARPVLLLVILVFGFVAPMVAEAYGWLESTWHVEEGALVYHPHTLLLGTDRTVALVVLASIAIILVAGVDAARLYRQHRDARLRLASQAWHLQQLIPKLGVARV
jgi:hypothetical protein